AIDICPLALHDALPIYARGGGRRMTFHLKTGDTLPVLEAQLFAPDGTPFNLQGMQVRFRMGRYVDAPAEIVDGSEGRVRYRWRRSEEHTSELQSRENLV